MRTIESGGGSLIAVNLLDLPEWGGIDELKFFTGHFSISSDYDAICAIGIDNPNQVIDVAHGSGFDIFMIAMPLPTLVVEATTDHVYIAQIETSEQGWSEADLRAADFELAMGWKDPVRVRFKSGEYIFFDSAYVASDLRDSESLRAHFQDAIYSCEWSSQVWAGKARMNFIRMVRADLKS